MRLIKIYSNKDSFEPVVFKNQSGLNIIIASKAQTEEDLNKTSNGVGKSLLIALIRFCLGSDIPLDFKDKLTDWSFTLEFSINIQHYTVTRTVDGYKFVTLNNEKIKVELFKQRLAELVFRIPKDTKGLTFGSLFPFFIRPQKNSYINELDPNSFFKPYDLQINNSLLLGLNTSLVKDKKENKDAIDKNKGDISRLGKDDVIREFFTRNQDSKIGKEQLEKEINDLKNQLDKLEIAQDYYNIRTQADQTKVQIDKIQNELEISQIQIENIQQSLELRNEITKNDIINIYQESNLIFNSQTTKTLEQLESFYNAISSNRSERLRAQKQDIEEKQIALKSEKITLEKRLNEKLQYLDTHQALDVYKSVSTKLSDLKIKFDKIGTYNSLIASLDLKKATLYQTRADENLKTVKYLQSNEFQIIEEANNFFFKNITRMFYPESNAGISIKNDDRDNQSRYRINVRIESDRSDGINNVKLFCYDLLLLMMGYNHNMGFIFHDSRILNGIDPRQTYTLFKVAYDYFTRSNKQYIITVNYNDLDSIKNLFETEAQYKSIITDNIIHVLKDSSPEEKLLGVQIDLDYEKTKN